jgi:hypothetical protein
MLALPLKAAEILSGFTPDWFVAGGWAIDLFVGKETRPHADIEIAIWRRDQAALYDYLSGGSWILKKAAGGKLSAWPQGEFLELPIHEIHCFNELAEPGRIEVLLNESNKDEWLYRRNTNIRRPLDKCYLVSKTGIKYLAPEIVLLYKSKNPKDKDERDFRAVVKLLAPEQRRWLKTAISAGGDPEHRWLADI